MKRLSKLLNSRNRMAVIVIGLILACGSLFFTSRMAQTLREKEQHDVQIWALAMERTGGAHLGTQQYSADYHRQ